MHQQALDAVARMIATSGYAGRGEVDTPRLGLDLGGADVNGTARDLFSPAVTWLGLDIAPGPGVDIVADARTWAGGLVEMDSGHRMINQVDLILCTELLEHVAPVHGRAGWAMVLENIWRLLAPGGFAFITCAGTDGRTGRRPHGARGELDPPHGEFYGNVPYLPFVNVVLPLAGTDSCGIAYTRDPGDIYAWLRK